MEIDRPNVVLTGFMGTGKTTVGRLLAAELDYEFVDTDELIQQRHGPIPLIFGNEGEAAFREMERQVARELAERTGVVIATGGHMLLDPANAETLGSNSRVFCLVATPEEIVDRIAADDSGQQRPLLEADDPRERVVELLRERRNGYGRFVQEATSGKTPSEVASRIASQLRFVPIHLGEDSSGDDDE